MPARSFLRGIVLLPAALLAACTASWQAPLESRGPGSYQAPPQPQASIRGKTYKVQRGDTLYSIAWRSGKDFRTLARWNAIRSPYTIYPGQVLRLSAPTTLRSTPRSRTQATSKPATTRRSQTTQVEPTATSSAPSGKSTARADASLRWQWPVNGPVLVKYSAKDPTRKGIKIGGAAGQQVKAAESGRVVYSGSGLIGYGQLIIIKHSESYLSAYGHNAKLRVKEGDQVARGKHIADMGRSNEGRPMLHFEIRRGGRPVDPLGLLPRK